MSKSILLVEDDVFLNQLYKDLLSGEGYHVDAVMDGQLAFEKIKTNNWDLILLDVILPIIDGYEIFNRIKKTGVKLKCPLVFMTNLDANKEDKAKLALADEYWVKSNMSPPEFLARVKKILL